MVDRTKRLPLVRLKSFYVGLSLLMTALAVIGFWPTYVGPLIAGEGTHPVVIHFHALVFSGWLGIFFAQAAFAATGRLTWHFRLGRVGIPYGVFLIAVGLATGVIRSAEREPGADVRFLLTTFSDMLVFGVFFVLAIAYRKKPQIHKRAMIVAATMLLIAPTARFWFIPEFTLPAQFPAFLGFWILPILVAIAYDMSRRRLVHPIYAAGVVTAVLRIYVPRAIGPTETWSGIAEQVFEFWNL